MRFATRATPPSELVVGGTPRNSRFKVVYRVSGKNVTHAVSIGSYRTRRLAPGKSVLMTITVTRTAKTKRADRRNFQVHAASAHTP